LLARHAGPARLAGPTGVFRLLERIGIGILRPRIPLLRRVDGVAVLVHVQDHRRWDRPLIVLAVEFHDELVARERRLPLLGAMLVDARELLVEDLIADRPQLGVGARRLRCLGRRRWSGEIHLGSLLRQLRWMWGASPVRTLCPSGAFRT